jgi:ABC-type glycerol-3-phosphate transport system permease component
LLLSLITEPLISLGVLCVFCIWEAYKFEKLPHKEASEETTELFSFSRITLPLVVTLVPAFIALTAASIFNINENTAMLAASPIIIPAAALLLCWPFLPHRWTAPKSVRKKLKETKRYYLHGYWK